MSVAVSPEPRIHPRVPAVLRVCYDDPAQLLDYTENMSESGLFIATEHDFGPGDEIAFELSFPGLIKPIRLAAVVVWRRARQCISDPEPPGIGVELRFSSDIERSWLRKMVARFAKTDRPEEPVPTRQPPSILVVEANPTIRELFAGALRTRLFEDEFRPQVLEAEDAKSAVDMILRGRIDLVVVESLACLQAEVDLLEVARTRGRGKAGGHLPVVVVAGPQEQLSTYLKSTADVFLRRPVPAKALLYTAKMLLSTHGG